MSHYQALLEDLEVNAEDVESFQRTNVGLHGVEVSRLSRYFLAQLSSFHKHRNLNTFAITDVVQSLEGLGRPLLSKSESQFQDLPLKGFWKAHFVDSSFLSKNLANELQSRYLATEFGRLCARIDAEETARPTIHGWQGRLAHAQTYGSYASRTRRRALTGEWLIFAKHGNENYYLCVARHPSSRQCDHAIYSQIKQLCAEEFPFLFSHEP